MKMPNMRKNRYEESNFNGNQGKRRNQHFNSPHYSHSNSSKYKKTTEAVKETSTPVQTCFIVSHEGVKSRNIILGNEPVTAVVNTGSSVSLIREDVSRRIVDHSKLS
ncbi:hypothetical protein AVEN_172382-1 [Araneus ventricosus]|uniref:Peptidase A2 domain-containing protein n=1 Tax=Araneus ventricosus TaxID=182803 RepID=A0A4Y2J4G9_ARAVE|nr:hypothetical protein AVEN_245087-1 [Araneus ventricosus]GBM84974.1 hypothetical protein AVEN_109946-1 [Araneus ventricosus]GBM85017.1 hypothetical protein AVEN_131443-1 [Araneus ventricosus]GBM85076.1 hypothetical protein AVEN_172382-1 [Araneus ventricosus]